jgi:hypothetical protein
MQFHVTSLAKLVFTIEFCDGHPVATTPGACAGLAPSVKRSCAAVTIDVF